MKAVIFSINKPHTDNILLKLKTSELRTRPPKIEEPYKAYIYETKKNGGCGKVIAEFIAFNENTYRICMGVPQHILITGWVSMADVLRYTENGKKDLTEISITDLKIYDEPKELSDFKGRKLVWRGNNHIRTFEEIKKPPQSWCYVEEYNELPRM